MREEAIRQLLDDEGDDGIMQIILLDHFDSRVLQNIE